MSKEKKKYEAPEATEKQIVSTELLASMQKALETATNTINTLKENYNSVNDKYLRALADYQNLQRTSATRISNSKRDGKISILRSLIPIIDDFERAIDAGEVTDGIKLIYDSLVSLLKNFNVEIINPNIGDVFDDLTQEAVIPIAALDENVKNTVAIVQQKGYKLEDVIIRYAKVGVYV